MRAGRLRQIIEIQENRGTSADSFGQATPEWVTLWKRYAEIEPIKGGESLVNGQYRADSSYRVRMRWFDGLTVLHRIKWGSRILAIGGVVNRDERSKEMELTCKERV